ncbi:hypothetical protein B0J18DRAFT_140307 [Chaetomium sp. MPI-SDFR-AT-0129]|nr:hypothetical protein B0J18DRAFT_140307 [Chaetomium sp. MPI-SDFR-AT-0129]
MFQEASIPKSMSWLLPLRTRLGGVALGYGPHGGIPFCFVVLFCLRFVESFPHSCFLHRLRPGINIGFLFSFASPTSALGVEQEIPRSVTTPKTHRTMPPAAKPSESSRAHARGAHHGISDTGLASSQGLLQARQGTTAAPHHNHHPETPHTFDAGTRNRCDAAIHRYAKTLRVGRI